MTIVAPSALLMNLTLHTPSAKSYPSFAIGFPSSSTDRGAPFIEKPFTAAGFLRDVGAAMAR